MRRLFHHKKNSKGIPSFLVYLSMTFLFGTIVFSGLDAELDRSVGYNCELSEYSPEFTPEMKKECKRMKNKGIVYRYDT